MTHLSGSAKPRHKIERRVPKNAPTHVNRIIPILLACFIGAIPGRCEKTPTDTARAKTLQALSASETNLLINASRKCAVLLYGMPAAEAHSASSTIVLRMGGAPNSTLGGAMAVSVDKAGYFLTAAHLTDAQPLTLIFHDGHELHGKPARVVTKIANRTNSTPATDLALIHVDAKLPEVFTWSKTSTAPKRLALQIGLAKNELISPTNMLVQFQFFAGHTKRLKQLPSGGAIIYGDLPVRGGDSGGPLLNGGGELIAIHSGLFKSLLRAHRSIATAPDYEWLRDAITADQQIVGTHLPHANAADLPEPVFVTVRFPQ